MVLSKWRTLRRAPFAFYYRSIPGVSLSPRERQPAAHACAISQPAPWGRVEFVSPKGEQIRGGDMSRSPGQAKRDPEERSERTLLRASKSLRQVDCVALEVGELAELQRALVTGAQHDAWRRIRLESLLPTRRTQTPAIAGL